MGYVSGVEGVLKGISAALDDRRMKAEALATDMAARALRIFQQHQFASLHEPDGKGKADTSSMKAEARAYAAAHQNIDEKTSMGDPWKNRTFRAARTVYADAGSDEKSVWFKMYHTMSYGVFLELGKNRKYAVLEPIMRGLAPEFFEGLKKIYGTSK